jgi:hypothetical protein
MKENPIPMRIIHTYMLLYSFLIYYLNSVRTFILNQKKQTKEQ